MKHDPNLSQAPSQAPNDYSTPLDLLIIGAGLSGICQAWHFQKAFPAGIYAILEGRADLGGTWDLFRYPGVRSDSDMQTLGYAFRPWRGDAAIADGESILRYIRETAADGGIDAHIRYHHRVMGLSWDSDTALWTVAVQVRAGDDPVPRVLQMTARFVVNCAGYFDYAKGYMPDWPDLATFKGRVIHPQFWPQDFNPAGQRITVIGSGATAVTLIPELARAGAKVTMLQRSPGYIFAMPKRDVIGNGLRRVLGDRLGHRLTRWKNVAFNTASYQLAKRAPALAWRVLRAGMRKGFGPEMDMDRHFAPRYAPWDQRICVAPDGDFFTTLRHGKAEVVTDEIAGFTETGVRLSSGGVLDSDVIVTATGLVMRMGGGISMVVDGRQTGFEETFCYKGALYSGLPNFAVAIGYVNASWTLKCELIARYVVRLMQHMDRGGWHSATPSAPPANAPALPTFDLTSGYIVRARSGLPRQTDRGPWKLNQDYILDSVLMTRGRVTDHMIFGRARVTAR